MHRARREGPRVPDRHRLGHDDRAAARRTGVQVLWPPSGGCEIRLRVGSADRSIRAAPARRRGDGLSREAAAPVRRVHARARPSRSSRRTARNETWVTTRRPGRMRELLWHAAQGSRFSSSVAPVSPTRRAARDARRSRAASARGVAGRARRRVQPGTAEALHRRHDARTPRRRVRDGRDRSFGRRRSWAAEAAARSRAAAVEQGPLRHRDRPRGARRAADGRSPTGHWRRTTRRPRRPPPKVCSARRRRSLLSPAPRSRARPSAPRAARPHWRETYVAVPVEGMTLEGYVDLDLPRRARARRRRLQDRRSRRRPRPGPPNGPLPDPGRGVRPRDGRSGRGTGRGVRLRLPRSGRRARDHDRRCRPRIGSR